MFAICLLIFASCVVLHEALRVKNSRCADDNKATDRILIPVAVVAAIVGVLAV